MTNTPNMVTSAHDLAAFLDWYDALGADCALEDAPQDRFEETTRQQRARLEARAKAAPNQSLNPSGPLSSSPGGAHNPAHSLKSGTEFHQSASPQNQTGFGGQGAASQSANTTFTSRVGENQSPSSNQSDVSGRQTLVRDQSLVGNPSLAGQPEGLNPISSGLVEEARQRAANAPTLTDLRQALSEFNGCSLKFSAKSLVFGDGNPDGDVMFIGEAPGRDEDIQGLPFVGRAGQLLDKMMAAINLDRTNSYITNILPWRPPGNRKPSLDEQAMLRPFIHRHIELVNPKILVFLGGTAAQQLLESKDGIMRLRGRWKSYAIADREIPAMSTLHPAFLLRTPAQKRAAWQDLLDVAAKLESLD